MSRFSRWHSKIKLSATLKQLRASGVDTTEEEKALSAII
jgi:hypothetical protein